MEGDAVYEELVGLVTRTYYCIKCKKDFNTTSKEHKFTYHEGPYPCSACAKEFANRKRRSQHQVKVHQIYLRKRKRAEVLYIALSSLTHPHHLTT
jgi:DNA-directed RNA polymerase subunit RPC12/RpoP